MQTIVSKDNLKLKQLRALLKSKKERQAESCFVIESVRALSALLDGGALPQYRLREIWISNKVNAGDVERFASTKTPLYQIPHELMEQFADCCTSQGVLGVVEYSPAVLTSLPAAGNFLLADGVADPGNLGTLIRTAAAFGFSGVILYGDTVEIFNPKTVRATMGALPFIPHWNAGDEIFGLIKSSGYELFSTVIHGGETLPAVKFGARNILAIGSEAHGVSSSVQKNATRGISIPISPAVESLNAAVAGAICMFAMQK